jgi:hypothetical protein
MGTLVDTESESELSSSRYVGTVTPTTAVVSAVTLGVTHVFVVPGRRDKRGGNGCRNVAYRDEISEKY